MEAVTTGQLPDENARIIDVMATPLPMEVIEQDGEAVLRHRPHGVFGVFGVPDAASLSYYGLHAPNGAEGVGKATTRSVVAAIVMIFMANCFLSLVLYRYLTL